MKANGELGEVGEDSNLVKSLAGEAAQQSKGREQRKYYQTQLNKSCEEKLLGGGGVKRRATPFKYRQNTKEKLQIKHRHDINTY